MYADHIPLDINKTPQEILMEKVNAVNGLQLDFNDFVFEDPQVYSSSVYPNANTSVKIVPKLTSQFYNAFTIYYKRMDISEILSNDKVSVPRTNETQLSELIDTINQLFNINLTSDDYYDASLPTPDPLDLEAEAPVMFTCNVASFLFTGSYLLILNRQVVATDISSLETADVMIVIDQPYEAVRKSDIICRTSAGDTVSNFKFLRNTNTLTSIEVNKLLRVKDKGMIAYGDFKFNADLGDGAQDYDTNAILISNTGKVLGSLQDQFGAALQSSLIFCSDKQKKYVYVIDTTNTLGSEISQLYRFSDTGIIDSSFSLIGADYKVAYAKISAAGDIYVCTEMLTINEDTDADPATADVPVKQYWIERYKEDGSKDATFEKVKITVTGSGDPWPVACIDLIEGDADTTMSGIYVGFKMLEQPDSLGVSPVINGVPLIDGSYTTSFGFLPIIKVLDSGVVDMAFDVKQKPYTPKAIYEYDATQAPAIGDQYISATGNNVVMLTYRENPITGIKHKYPVLFNYDGSMKKISGDEYYKTFCWSQAKSVESLYNNSLLVFGTYQPRATTGEYLAERSLVASYDAKTQVQGIVYQVQDTANGVPTIKDVLIYETI